MIDAINKFFSNFLNPAAAAPAADPEHALRLATAALLIEMTHADYDVKDVERQAVRAALQDKFQLTTEETETLVKLAAAEASEATSLYQFTSLINEGFSQTQKIKVIELLWQIAYSDAELQRYEEHLVRKIADLLYVPHRDFIAAKLRVQEALQRTRDADPRAH